MYIEGLGKQAAPVKQRKGNESIKEREYELKSLQRRYLCNHSGYQANAGTHSYYFNTENESGMEILAIHVISLFNCSIWTVSLQTLQKSVVCLLLFCVLHCFGGFPLFVTCKLTQAGQPDHFSKEFQPQ